MPNSIYAVFILALVLLLSQEGYSQLAVPQAAWQLRDGTYASGRIVVPDQLLTASQYVLVQARRGYQRLRVNEIEWLAIGADTVLRHYPAGHSLAGIWQLLAGGTYDLYLQRSSSAAPRLGIPLPWPISWIGAVGGRRSSYRYALHYADRVDLLDRKRPTAALRTLEGLNCPSFASLRNGSRPRRLLLAGQVLNDCAPSGVSYLHHLRGARWEFSLSAVLATIGRQPGEVRRHNWSGRFTLTKPLGRISRQLSLELAFGQFHYRQRLELEVVDRVRGIAVPFYTVERLSSPTQANYLSSWRQDNTVLNVGLRWEIQPDAPFSLLFSAGAAHQLPTTYRLEVSEINDNPLLGVPVRTTIVRDIPGGWQPYASFGFRMRLRHDWRLGLQLRSEPVFVNLERSSSSDDFRSTMQFYAEAEARRAFSQAIALSLTKVLF